MQSPHCLRWPPHGRCWPAGDRKNQQRDNLRPIRAVAQWALVGMAIWLLLAAAGCAEPTPEERKHRAQLEATCAGKIGRRAMLDGAYGWTREHYRPGVVYFFPENMQGAESTYYVVTWCSRLTVPPTGVE
jgi:hypothetical protein